MAVVCVLTPVPDPANEWEMWKLSTPVKRVHVTDVRKWSVIPSQFLCPLELRRHSKTETLAPRLLIKKTGRAVPLLRHAFSLKVELSWEQLLRLVEYLGITRPPKSRSRQDLITSICEFITEHDDEETRAA